MSVALTVRLTAAMHTVVSEEAERQGVPLATYVREAALARAFVEVGIRFGSAAQPSTSMHFSDWRRELIELDIAPDEVIDRFLEWLIGAFDRWGPSAIERQERHPRS